MKIKGCIKLGIGGRLGGGNWSDPISGRWMDTPGFSYRRTRQDTNSRKDIHEEGQGLILQSKERGGSAEDLGTEKVRRRYKYRTV